METDAKGYVSEKDRDEVFRTQLSILENRTCFDCDSPNPSWLSLSFAVYLCLNCSGRHRQLGTHISFVRSIDMDKFTIKQLNRMIAGGNKRAMIYFNSKQIPRNAQGYSSKAASVYKTLLDEQAEQASPTSDRPLPTPTEKSATTDDWFDKRIKSITYNQKLGARELNNREFDNLLNEPRPSPSGFTHERLLVNEPATSSYNYNTYNYNPPSLGRGGSSSFRTNTAIPSCQSSEYWPNLEETAQQNIQELKEGIKTIISKGNKYYNKAKTWFNNI